ncbi:preprotein translocase subunit YajC [Solilutibacter silvestris]|uniref:Sec translocon accessory complex subunit YajC n=1 Tax=Solilutibacter silvestris TaxID=1645665 RepID=A0A2K1PYB5_9GAMM|nr:preprotein translocase subunit YajC [Lysobacter silvestris]PNS07667.1 yajC: preprotein translocase, YajC subunit [Lysobacter silvestris]
MSPIDFLIAPAAAQTAQTAQPPGSGLSLIVMVPVFILLMYFMVIRPQSKRSKDHKALMDKLSKGDEVLTNSGIAGVVTEIGENFVSVEVADNVRMRIQRGAIANVLPKGTLKNA